MYIPGTSVTTGSTTVTTVAHARHLVAHEAALIRITVVGEPDPLTEAITRHVGYSGSVYLELPDGTLALILDLCGGLRITRAGPRYLRD
jgi:hypothetical protein